MTTYSCQFLAESVEKLSSFLTKFYKTSDTKPLGKDPYVDFFTPDAQVFIGPTEVCGTDEIAEMRRNIWTSVVKRHHEFQDVAHITETEVMVTGTVEYGLVNGKRVNSLWAAKLVFESPDYKRMAYYRVYLDPSAVAKALAT